MKEIHDLDELKSIELRLMKVIHDVCTHNNIWYELAYGTLIGAVRHNGFIPWDDDIDIFMYRKDLNKFLEAIERHKESDHIMIASPKNGDIYFPRDIIKVCDSRTKLFEKTYKHEPIGVFVPDQLEESVLAVEGDQSFPAFVTSFIENQPVGDELQGEQRKKKG